LAPKWALIGHITLGLLKPKEFWEKNFTGISLEFEKQNISHWNLKKKIYRIENCIYFS
jgi:hypothetical protein